MTKKLPHSESDTLKFHVVVPARYASTRLPGKPLMDIAGKPMVVRVAERAKQSGAQSVTIATDDVRIQAVVQQYGYSVLMTRADHMSGTDRIAEVALKQGWSDGAIVVNVQGDEPLIDPGLIASVAGALEGSAVAVMATACHAIDKQEDFLNPNIVKVVLDIHQHALYFSRAPIPYPRETSSSGTADWSKGACYRHVGIYAYRTDFLRQYAQMPVAEIEKIESLEQLRVLYQGYKIAVAICQEAPAIGVDTEEDLACVRRIMQQSV